MAENREFFERIGALQTSRSSIGEISKRYRYVRFGDLGMRFGPAGIVFFPAADLRYSIVSNRNEAASWASLIFNGSRKPTQGYSPQCAFTNERQSLLHADDWLPPCVKDVVQRHFQKMSYKIFQRLLLGLTNAK